MRIPRFLAIVAVGCMCLRVVLCGLSPAELWVRPGCQDSSCLRAGRNLPAHTAALCPWPVLPAHLSSPFTALSH